MSGGNKWAWQKSNIFISSDKTEAGIKHVKNVDAYINDSFKILIMSIFFIILCFYMIQQVIPFILSVFTKVEYFSWVK